MVFQVRRDASVVSAQELLEHQVGHELRLGEVLWAKLVPVHGEGLRRRLVGDLESLARGFARSHISVYDPKWTAVHGFSTAQS
jgi:hypothetical protein